MLVSVEVFYNQKFDYADVYTFEFTYKFALKEECFGTLFASKFDVSMRIWTYCKGDWRMCYDMRGEPYKLPFDVAGFIVEIGFLPGVTDNVATTVLQMLRDIGGEPAEMCCAVHSSRRWFMRKQQSVDYDQICMQFYGKYNSMVEYIRVVEDPEKELYLLWGRPGKAPVDVDDYEVDLDVDDDELEKLSKFGIRGNGGLGLSFGAMRKIRDYFKGEGRKPYDIELEALAQTWSEHCKHNIFAGSIDDIQDGLYRHFIKRATREIISENKIAFAKWKWMFSDNAGMIAFDFDNEYLILDKVETHNSPSALEPFGGAMTGILGVNRDIIGCSYGGQPIANFYYFAFAESDKSCRRVYSARNNVQEVAIKPYPSLYRSKGRVNTVLSPEVVADGVIRGVEVGGNCSGIPTCLGGMYFNRSFRGKPLVFVGSVGIIPKTVAGRDAHTKAPLKGDLIVIIGGRVGRDGIHGATLSSVALNGDVTNSIVQIGDPTTQKKLSDAIIKEARDSGLYNAITDNGSGGLSSSVGEMGWNGAMGVKGFRVELANVPLKYPGMKPWEIWVSESQERMTLAVPKDKLQKLQDIMLRHDVEIAVIGEFNNSGYGVVEYYGKEIMRMRMDFMHDGPPAIHLETEKPSKSKVDEMIRENMGGLRLSEYDCLNLHDVLNKLSNLRQERKEVMFLPVSEVDFDMNVTLLNMLGVPNIRSNEFVTVRYDHEVQGGSVVKPLQGKGRVNGESIVIRPLLDRMRGIVRAFGLGNVYGVLDPYKMAANAIDTAVRNYIVVGGDIHHMALLDNFCWCISRDPESPRDPENPYDVERLWALKEAARACYDYAKAFRAPFISGKDSMFNDLYCYDGNDNPVHIAALPTILISTVGCIEDVTTSVTMDLKCAGDYMYVLGETRNELGMSEFQLNHVLNDDWLLGNDIVSTVDGGSVFSMYRKYVEEAVRENLINSGIAVNLGGLGIAISKSVMAAGTLGARVDLSCVSDDLTAIEILFSETCGRLLVTVPQDKHKDFESLMLGHSVKRIGQVIDSEKLIICMRGEEIINLDTSELKAQYSAFSDERQKVVV